MKKLKIKLLLMAMLGVMFAFTACGAKETTEDGNVTEELSETEDLSAAYDLEEAEEFKVEDILNINLSGVSKNGTLDVATIVPGLTVEADKNSNLSNGDEVTITFSSTYFDKSFEEVCEEANLPAFDPVYKYKVEGLCNYVTSPSEIPENVLKVMERKAETAIESIKTSECNCQNDLFPDQVKHDNFDTYELVGIGVATGEEAYGRVGLIYALHYSVHGDVTTYYTVTFNEIMDSEDELTDSDIYPFNTYLECSIDNRLYEGAESIEDIKNSQCEIVGTTDFVVDESSSL